MEHIYKVGVLGVSMYFASTKTMRHCHVHIYIYYIIGISIYIVYPKEYPGFSRIVVIFGFVHIRNPAAVHTGALAADPCSTS